MDKRPKPTVERHSRGAEVKTNAGNRFVLGIGDMTDEQLDELADYLTGLVNEP